MNGDFCGMRVDGAMAEDLRISEDYRAVARHCDIREGIPLSAMVVDVDAKL